MDLMCRWFRSNLDIVFFIYGLAFVTMGIAILVQPKKESNFKLANTSVINEAPHNPLSK